MSGGASDGLGSLSSRLFGSHFHTARFLSALFTGIVAALIVSSSGISDPLDELFLDFRMRLRPNIIQPQVPVRIAFFSPPASSDDTSFARQSRELLRHLEQPGLPSEERPGVLVFSKVFGGESISKTDAEKIIALSREVQEADATSAVVHSMRVVKEPIVHNPGSSTREIGFPMPPNASVLRRADAILLPLEGESGRALVKDCPVGFINIAHNGELGDVVRSVPLIMRYRDRVIPSLGLASAMAASGVGVDDVRIRPGEAVVLTPLVGPPISVPIDLHGNLYLNFRPTLGMLRMTDLLSRFNFAQPPSEVLSFDPADKLLETLKPAGRILIVGDPRILVRTPLGAHVPLANVHAQVATDILTGEFLERVHTGVDLFLAFFVVLLFAYYVGRWDPQGLGPVGAAILIGASHGAFATLVFGLLSYWMNMALVLETFLLTVPFDGLFLNYHHNRVTRRLRSEIDTWETEESGRLERFALEEKEQAERLEQLRMQESLARSILDRQEALVARVITNRGQGGSGGSTEEDEATENGSPPGEAGGEPVEASGQGGEATETTEATDDPSDATETTDATDDPADATELAANRRVQEIEGPIAAHGERRRRGSSQPEVIRELSSRYRNQASRQDALLTRYRQLLDQVLAQLEESWTRQPVPLNLSISDAMADDLVSLTGVVTRNPAMLQLLHQLVTRVGPNDRATVLIQGESGTGKELIARAIHRHSNRSNAPFIALNCSAVSEGLIESELFGHVKGAFSGAAKDRRGAFVSAEGGVLFLDEIGDAPPSIQAKLLRALQERAIRPVGSDTAIPVNVRIVAATNRDLKEEIRSSRFREDLYHRLHVIPIGLPPLRARPEDISLLINFFLEREAKAGGHPVRALTEGAAAALAAHKWPGNIRELENCIVALDATATELLIDDVMVAKALGQPIQALRRGQNGFSSMDMRWLEAFRRHQFAIVATVADSEAPARNRQTGYRRLVGLVCKALYLTNWSTEQAAELLAGTEDGLNLRKAMSKIKTYLKSLEQAMETKDPVKFENEWRRFLGEDVFFVKATVEAIQAGKLSSAKANR